MQKKQKQKMQKKTKTKKQKHTQRFFNHFQNNAIYINTFMHMLMYVTQVPYV